MDKEKGLKALEIIKNKRICVDDIIYSKDYNEYVMWFNSYKKSFNDEHKKATNKEYDLLKEVLNNEKDKKI